MRTSDRAGRSPYRRRLQEGETVPTILIACRVLEKELLHSLPSGADVEIVWLEAGLHASLPRLEEALGAAIAGRSLRDERLPSSTARVVTRR